MNCLPILYGILQAFWVGWFGDFIVGLTKRGFRENRWLLVNGRAFVVTNLNNPHSIINLTKPISSDQHRENTYLLPA